MKEALFTVMTNKRWRKKWMTSLLAASIVLGSLAQPVPILGAPSIPEGNTALINDDFEGVTDAAIFPSSPAPYGTIAGYTPAFQAGAASNAVDNLGIQESVIFGADAAVQGNSVFVLTDSNDGSMTGSGKDASFTAGAASLQVRASKTFSEAGISDGMLTFELDYWVTDISKGQNILRILGGENNAEGTSNVLIDIQLKSRKIAWVNSSGTFINITPANLESKKWYHLKAVVDLTTLQASYYVTPTGGSSDLGTLTNQPFRLNSSGTSEPYTVTDTLKKAYAKSIYFGTAGSSVGYAAYDNVQVYKLNAAPEAPSGLGAAAGNTQAALYWSAAQYASTYDILRGLSAAGPFDTIASGLTAAASPAAPYYDANLVNGTTYYYVVRAVNDFGAAVSAPLAVTPSGDNPLPQAPAAMASDSRDSAVLLTWEGVAEAETYTLKRSTSPAGGYTVLAQLPSSQTSYYDTKLTNGTTYYYTLTSSNAAGVGLESAPLAGTPSAPVPSPANVKAAATSSGKVMVAWDNVAGASAYTVKRSTVSGGPYTVVAENVNASSYTDEAVTNATAYYYVVSAAKGTLQSMNSLEAAAITGTAPAGTLAPPDQLVVTAGDSQAVLTWNEAPGATGYRVYRSTAWAGPYTALAAPVAGLTYTDASAQNNTSYYYAVAAVNASGEGLRSLPAAGTPADRIVVAKDGSGDYTTVQAAVNSIPSNNTERKVIYIRDGYYYEKLLVDRPYISFIGESKDGTILAYDDYACKAVSSGGTPSSDSFSCTSAGVPIGGMILGTGNSYSMKVTADHFSAHNLTILNTAFPRSVVAPAVALYVTGDQAVFTDIRAAGFQDTLYVNSGRQYYRNVIIEGDADWIFGNATVVFDQSEIKFVGKNGGYVTAASTDQGQAHGYVFLNSKLTRGTSYLENKVTVNPWDASWDIDSNLAATDEEVSLGRPWRPYANVKYINTWMDQHIEAAGWNNWGDAANEKTASYGEYNSTGPGAKPAARQAWSRQLTSDEANQYTVPNVLKGDDGWNPLLFGVYPMGSKTSSEQPQEPENPPSEQKVLFIGTGAPSDKLQLERLQALGFIVTEKTDRTYTAADAAGMTLVFVAESVSSSRIGANLKNIEVPVFYAEPFAMDDVQLASAAGGEVGAVPGNEITIKDSTHPIAAGLSGDVAVYTGTGNNMNYANPTAASEAVIVAVAKDDPSKVTIFAYEKGAKNVAGDPVPARQVFFYLFGVLEPANQTADGWKLFDAAVSWAAGGAVIKPVKPTAPTGLTATAGNGEVMLSWDSSSLADSYTVKRSTQSGGSYTVIAEQVSGTNYTDTGAANGTAYYYVVTAVNANGESPNSQEVSATPVAPLPEVTGTAAAAGNKQVTLTWNAVEGATTYKVIRSSLDGLPYHVAAEVTGTSYVDANLKNDFTYFYIIKAFGPSGELASSRPVSAKPTVQATIISSELTSPTTVKVTLSEKLTSFDPADFQLQAALGTWYSYDPKLSSSYIQVKDVKAETNAEGRTVLLFETQTPLGSDAAIDAPVEENPRSIPYLKAAYYSGNREKDIQQADHLLTWQMEHGGWYKYSDQYKRAWNGTESKSDWKSKQNEDLGTIDNDATTNEILFLALMYKETGDERYKDAVVKGLRFLLKLQYDSGGFAQVYPRRSGYSDYVTFNDNAMIRAMNVITMAAEKRYPFNSNLIDESLSGQLRTSLDRGLDYILKSQIKVNGILAAWCAQHDPVTYEPREARSYEHPSISGSESVEIIKYLLSLRNPSLEVQQAIAGALDWFDKSRIVDMKYVSGDPNNVYFVPEAGTDVWYRFYDVTTNWPIFSGRDGIIKHNIMEIEEERRNGYSWGGTYAQKLFQTVRSTGYYENRIFIKVAGSSSQTESGNALIVGELSRIEPSAPPVSTPPSAPSGLEGRAHQGEVVLSWNAASGAASYAVKRSTASGGPYETIAASVTQTTYTDNHVIAGTGYYYIVTASNAYGEGPASVEISVTAAGGSGADIAAPSWTNGQLTASEIRQRSLKLTWSGAGDNVGVTGYRIYTALGETMTLLAETGQVNIWDVTNLGSNTSYTFTIRAGDAAGNWSEDGPSVTVRTPRSRGGGDTGPSAPATPAAPTEPSAPSAPAPQAENSSGEARVKMNLDDAASVSRETDNNGRTSALVEVDSEWLTKAFSVAASGPRTIVIAADSSDDAVRVKLPAALLAATAAEQPGSAILIQLEGASYRLPLSVVPQLPKGVVIEITVSKATGGQAAQVKSAAEQAGVISVLDAYDFSIQVDGKPVNDFGGKYIERTLTISHAVDPNRVTAVWVDEAGAMHFVPSVFTSQGNGTEVSILSPHNSVYTVIAANQSFTDLVGHWSRTEVEVLANKQVVRGGGDGNFSPDNSITRAEFAALLVRSLGLTEKQGAPSIFTDIKANDWFAGAVGAAYEAGLISGYSDGTFKPNAPITREQMAVMVANALKAAGKELEVDVKVLTPFADEASIAAWAREAAATAVEAGIVQGTETGAFSPQSHATRAQSAVMLLRMLQYLEFINR